MRIEYHTEETLDKVKEALTAAGCGPNQINDCIVNMANAGILFREIKPEKNGIERLYDLDHEFRMKMVELEELQRDLGMEFRRQLSQIDPVLKAIHRALNPEETG